jgi:hypothetical protein
MTVVSTIVALVDIRADGGFSAVAVPTGLDRARVTSIAVIEITIVTNLRPLDDAVPTSLSARRWFA